jgi:protein-L-isoaspartate O-methyltransferase
MSLKLIVVRTIYRLKGFFEDPLELFRILGVEHSDRILEIGCAIGYHTVPLSKIAFKGRVYAVDIWEEGLSHLRRMNLSNVTIISGCEAVEMPPSSLDKVVWLDTLHEVINPGNVIESWTQFLKKGGKFFYRDPEISPDNIHILSKDRLRYVDTSKGVSIFVRQ